MDELEETAKDYCSHLSRSKSDWKTRMVRILTDHPKLPIYQKDRLKLYADAGIPDKVALDVDGQALIEALAYFHKGITGNNAG